LTALGAGSLAACRGHERPASLAALPEGWSQGEEHWVTTTCGQCPAGCGIKVRVFEGRAVKIEGNPTHPINGGGLGPKGQSGLQLLYHPDRIRGPLRRVGPRGSGQWSRVTWDSAIGEIAEALGRLRSTGDARSLVVLDGEPRGVVPRLWDRFLRAYGSPNHVGHASTTDGASVLTMTFMQGVASTPAYDWRNTNYVLGFGVGLFESWCQTIHMSRASGTMRRGTPGRRTKFVHVSPRFSVTAARSDEWIPIAPATDGALALGLAHVLIRERLYDESFVKEHTFGFDGWRDKAGRTHRGFRDLALADYPPDAVARITGVDAGTIERLARELSAHRPAIALGDGAACGATNALGTAMAIHALNALLGSVERKGGVLAQRPVLSSWDAFKPDSLAETGLLAERIDGRGTRACPLGHGAVQSLPAAILADRPYPTNALILYRSNPVFSKPEGSKWVQALRKVPLVVSCSPLPDESTFWADFVLPDHTYLERSEIVEAAPSSGQPVIGLRQPVVPPRHNTMATGDLVIRLARSLGAPVADAFPWSDSREAIAGLLQGIEVPESDRGDLPAEAALLAQMRKNGGWWGTRTFEGWKDGFATPSRKFEFYSQSIASRLAALFPDAGDLDKHLSGHGVMTRADDLCLPHWEPARFAGDPRQYPFLLAPYRAINYAEGGVRHLPWLRELPSAGRLAWKETIEVNPHDADRLGVREGDAVWIESPAGRHRMHVRIHAGTLAGIIGLPLGHGQWPPDPAEAGTVGGHGLLTALSDPLAGILAHQGTRVRVWKEDA
jgi:anaerobic selenocysteine-containing dehydrogenase